MKVFFVLIISTLCLSGCLHRGKYRIQGTYDKVALGIADTKIGVLDPRGYVNTDEAFKTQLRELGRLTKCPTTLVLSEADLQWTSIPPPPYGDRLTEDNLTYMATHTDLDYVIFTEFGPGRSEAVPGLGFPAASVREAFAYLVLYDVETGEEVKTITVNGSLNADADSAWWELWYEEDQMSVRALRKGLRHLVEYTSCK
ncbi:hypothetical protein [Neolewinella antarctica]|uniref:Lipoprotein n=1 Tax=Neolewinella antarctica TaxID=442734 RepID=A0ABX0XAI9_9BACT|nr:hypothetical protein [Neolewinella antarctica]NJC26273.1 hypothetical protein [Neolewinella antarctica]